MADTPTNQAKIEIPEKDPYRRIKKISFLMLKSERRAKEERMTLYDNKALPIFIWAIYFGELLKDLYFAVMPLSVEQRVLFGDILLSDRADQALFNLIVVIVYLNCLDLKE